MYQGKKIYLLCVALIAMAGIMNLSNNVFADDHAHNLMAESNETVIQKPAWNYFERLSNAFGLDSVPAGINDIISAPDWFSGCYVNKNGRLTINVVGDTVTIRKMLRQLFGSNDFDLSLVSFSKNDQIQVLNDFRQAIAQDTSALTDYLFWSTNNDGTIKVILKNISSKNVEKFKNTIFDSPIIQFKIYDMPDTIEPFENPEPISPQFLGGTESLMNLTYDNLRYPEEAKDIEGRVFLQFYIKPDGKTDSLRVVKGLNPYLDAEALRLASLLPDFIPGSFRGKNIGLWLTLPVRFNRSEYLTRKSKKYQAYKIDNSEDKLQGGLYRIINENGRFGFADENGNIVITPRFVFAFPFIEGKAKVTDWNIDSGVIGAYDRDDDYGTFESSKWYYIDKTGKKIY